MKLLITQRKIYCLLLREAKFLKFIIPKARIEGRKQTPSYITGYYYKLVYVCSVVSDFATLWTVAHQASLSLGFSRQEYCSGLPCPPPGNLPDPRSNLCLLHYQVNSLPLSHLGIPV